jgi:hypothetical protein
MTSFTMRSWAQAGQLDMAKACGRSTGRSWVAPGLCPGEIAALGVAIADGLVKKLGQDQMLWAYFGAWMRVLLSSRRR